MPHKKSPSILNLALLVALATSPMTALYWSLESVIAQSPSVSPISPPTAVPAGSIVRIDGSNSLLVVNQSLKQSFENESSGTKVDIGSNGSEAALQAVLDDKADVAAIGRPLTAAEKQKGLVPVSIGREKIAIITSSKNPYSGDITFDQFAKIFRGEITNWSQLGGAPGKIRLVDRPETSDTRQAFKTYPVFKAAPFQTGATAETVSQDSTADVIQKLGNDGIAYAVYSQVKGVDGVKIISMHQTLPDNPAYPFSQPRYFVAKATPAAPAKDFLAYATGASGLAAIAAANQAEVAAIAAGATPGKDLVPTPAVAPNAAVSPDAATSPSPESIAIAPVPNATNRGLAGLIPWLLLVPAAILGWIWWSGRGRRAPTVPLSGSTSGVERSPQPPVAEPMAEAPPAAQPSSPPIAAIPPVVQSPSVSPVLPVPPVSSVPAIEDGSLPEPLVGGSSKVSGINPAILGGAAIAGAAGLAGLASNRKAEPVPPIPVDLANIPTTEPASDLSVTEEVSSMASVTPAPVAEVPITTEQPDLNLGLAAAALAAGAGAALWATRSQDADPESVAIPAAAAGLPISGNFALADVDDGLVGLPASYEESRIVLMPRDPQWAYAYWDVSDSHKAALRREGGDRLALRFYDVTDTELSQQNPHSLQQYDCEEIATNWYIPVPLSDRDYIVEIGYLTKDERWLMLARSAPVRIPPIYPSDWTESQDVTISWDEKLSGKVFSVPLPYKKKVRTMHEAMYELAHGVESDRAAGSLYGSMETDSAHIFPSGVGMSGIGMSGIGMSGIGMGNLTTSGIGMSGIGMGNLTSSGMGMSGIGMGSLTTSGIGMSGVGMSGIGMPGIGMGNLTTSGMGMSGMGISGMGMSGMGFFASMPPIRSRKFWLVADAELIIYGATEPDATLTIAGRPVKLNPDGTFRFQMSFQDGSLDFPILAVASDGVQTRAIHLTFDRATPVRNTNQKDESAEEWLPNR